MARTLDQNLNIIQESGVEIQIDPLTRDLNIIQALDDEPNDVGGLSAAELKAKFDEAGNIIKGFINDSLIPQALGDGLSEQSRQENEAVRQANEAQRQENETARQEAEAAREEAAAQLNQALTNSVNQLEEDVEEAEAARNVWEDYDPARAYVPGNKVYYLGSSYVNILACKDVLPTVTANWQMIAKKGADSDEGMSEEEADLRYLQLSGGRMTGEMTVLEPERDESPVNWSFAKKNLIVGNGSLSSQTVNPPFAMTLDTRPGRTLEDGANWTEAEMPKGLEPPEFAGVLNLAASDSWRGIAYGNGRFVAVSLKGYAAYSLDGEGWSVRTYPLGSSTYALNAVAYGSGRFVAVGSGNYAAYSLDGEHWDKAAVSPSTTNTNWTGVTYGNGRFVAAGPPGTAAWTDGGRDWTEGPLSSGAAYRYFAAAFGNGRFVAVGDKGYVIYSPDAQIWTGVSVPRYYSVFRGIAFGEGHFAAVGTPGLAAWSSDGADWLAADIPAEEWNAAAFGDGRFLAVGSNGQAAVSLDGGQSWAAGTIPAGDWRGAAFGDGRFVAVGDGGKAVWSADGGGTWTAGAVPAGDWKAAAFGNGRFVAVGSGGKAAWSADGGETWTEVSVTTDTSVTWLGIVYGNGRFMAVGQNGHGAYSVKRLWLNVNGFLVGDADLDVYERLEAQVSALRAENAALAAAVERGMGL